MPNRKTPVYDFNSNGALTALSPITIFTPAANTKGFKIFGGSAYELYTATPSTGKFVIATSAPSTISNGIAVSIVKNINAAGTTNFIVHNIVDDLFVPAGYGLYFISSVSSVITNTVVSYSDA